MSTRMTGRTLQVECATCPARDLRCGDCVVAVLSALPPLEASEDGLPLDANEARAVSLLHGLGLVSADVAAGAVAVAVRERVTRLRATG